MSSSSSSSSSTSRFGGRVWTSARASTSSSSSSSSVSSTRNPPRRQKVKNVPFFCARGKKNDRSRKNAKSICGSDGGGVGSSAQARVVLVRAVVPNNEEQQQQRRTNAKSAFDEFVAEISSKTVPARGEKNNNNNSSSAAVTSKKSAFELAGGFLYVRNFFEKEDFEKIERACDALRKHLKEEKRVCANSRLGVMVPEEDVVHQMCCSEYAAEKLRELVLSEEEKRDATKRYALKPSDVPVEYRIYPFGGSMDWHRDVALYTEPQFEIVCTIHNSSDSRTEWKDMDTGRRRGIRSEPNSVLIVQADSVVHRVTPITKGERSIVKFAYSTTNEKTVDYYDNLLTYNDDYEPEAGSNGKRASSSSSSSSGGSSSENFPSPH